MKILYSKIGKVYLVGAGPGDPELLTLKGVRCLRKADAVVYDRLVDPRILELAPRRAERIFVGKKGGHYAFPQDKINQLLVSYARKGYQVVRLKGGDPFLLGRGGEEALYLAEQKIPFEVIPGVTSAVAVPAAAGIPLTHRGLSSSVTIMTGQQAADFEDRKRWARLAGSADTLIVLMPLKNLRHIVSQLVLNGWPLDACAALIESGTLENQRQVLSTLRDIVARSAQARISSPALLIVGRVVELSALLARHYEPVGESRASSKMKTQESS